MNFLFVDRILQLEPGKRAIGIKHVSPDDSFLRLLPTGQIILSNAIVGETMGQLGAWIVMQDNKFSHRPIAGATSEVIFHGHAFLGETIVIETTVDSLDQQAVLYHSIAKINDKPIMELVNSIGPLLPMTDFNDPIEVKAQFEKIYRPGKLPTHYEGKLNYSINHLPFSHEMKFDRILEWVTGSYVKAQKNISSLAPYFADHFPRKPVMPLTLLLDCKFNLAKAFIADMVGEKDAQEIDALRLRRVRINNFIQPGDSIVTKMSLKSRDDQFFTFSYRTEIDDTKVCILEATFGPLK